MGTQDTAGSPAATTSHPPTVIHLVAGRGAAPARAWAAQAGASRAGERERRCSVQGSPQRDVIWRERGVAAGTGLQRDFCSKEAAGGPACGRAGPMRHCGPEAGAEETHSVTW